MRQTTGEDSIMKCKCPRHVGEAFTRAELKRQQAVERRSDNFNFAAYVTVAIVFLAACWLPGLIA